MLLQIKKQSFVSKLQEMKEKLTGYVTFTLALNT